MKFSLNVLHLPRFDERKHIHDGEVCCDYVSGRPREQRGFGVEPKP